nr:hypothetical protein [aff. Roholtiella sp. LEGE 12411]
MEYLRLVQELVLEPGMVDVINNLRDRILICTWIGENIDAINAQLQICLEACHQCFHPQDRPHIQIFAVPIAQSFGIDGLCNIFTTPITILVDVGRIAPIDWLGIVAHEYAHAHLGDSGHDQQFVKILSHLCLGLGFEPPHWEPGTESTLRSWPHCNSTIDPLEFWIGQQIY